MAKTLLYREVTYQDITHDHQLQQWLETHQQEKGIHYKREGKNVYILISGGKRPTGGYKIIVDEALLEALNTAYISAYIAFPKPGNLVTQKITYPYVCIQIENENIQDVQGALVDMKS